MSLADREAQLRASMMTHARHMGNRDAGRWVSCSALAIASRDHHGAGVDSDDQATRFIDELIGAGLMEEKDQPSLTPAQSRDLRYRRVRLTDLGYKLWSEQIDAHPLVWDRRVG